MSLSCINLTQNIVITIMLAQTFRNIEQTEQLTFLQFITIAFTIFKLSLVKVRQ
jgi:hypothetical protein